LRLPETRRLTRSGHLCKRKTCLRQSADKAVQISKEAILQKPLAQSDWYYLVQKLLVQKTSAQKLQFKNKWFKK
jgi:hypothetical protein